MTAWDEAVSFLPCKPVVFLLLTSGFLQFVLSLTVIGFCFRKWWVAFSFSYVCRILLVREAFLFLFLTTFYCHIGIPVPVGSLTATCFGALVLWLSEYPRHASSHAQLLDPLSLSLPHVHVHLVFRLRSDKRHTRPSAHQR